MKRVTSMAGLTREERGAALVIVLLFTCLTLILFTSMLSVTTNEAIVASLHRDGTLALELAQSGIQEAMRRVEEGRPYAAFTGSLNPSVSVTVTRRVVGINSAYQQIEATAVNGRAQRRLAALVLQRVIVFPPNIVFGTSVSHTHDDIQSIVASGDIYAWTYQWYIKEAVTPPLSSNVYAGWRMTSQGTITCYQAPCAGKPNWFPATRHTASDTTALGTDILAQTNKCPAGGGGMLPGDQITGVLASDEPPDTVVTVNAYGFDTDGGLAVTSKLPCGLPYKYVAETFKDEGGASVTRFFKMIVFEQWFDLYWQFDESQMNYVKKPALTGNPQYGAIPPVPNMDIPPNCDRTLTGGGLLTGDLGCKYPEMPCSPPQSRPILVCLIGNYTAAERLQGHGTLYVRGTLTVNQDFDYWGTIVVTGSPSDLVLAVFLGERVNIYGGIVTQGQMTMHERNRIFAGTSVTNIPVGRSVVIGKAWWER